MYTIYVKFDCLPGKREAFIERVKADGILAAIRADMTATLSNVSVVEKDGSVRPLTPKTKPKQ